MFQYPTITEYLVDDRQRTIRAEAARGRLARVVRRAARNRRAA